MHIRYHFPHFYYEFGSRSAAASKHCSACIDQVGCFFRKIIGRYVIRGYSACNLRKSGIGLNHNRNIGCSAHRGDYRQQFGRAQRTIDTKSRNSQPAYYMSHGFGVSSGQSSSVVLESHCDKNRQPGGFTGCKYCSLHFMKVGDSFNKYDVCAGFYSNDHLTLEYFISPFKTKVSNWFEKLPYWADVQCDKLSV